MAFTLYTDAKMTTEASSPYQLDFNGVGVSDFKLFFGSPYVYETLKPKSDQQIMLIPASRLKKWQAGGTYGFGNIVEPTVANGCMYQCLGSGQAGSNEPAWSTDYGSECTSGGLVFVNLGAKFQPTDIRLALKQSDLGSAVSGEALAIGTELKGGTAIPVYIRVTNSNNAVRTDRTDPCISIRLNATTTETVVQTG
ncbi:hypothetical protein [Snodgrassella alvi]|uniref:hypothetical protein n=1 Tax=Snodgrassella alvi TaxID=1196083 RepID=UPI0035124254